MEYKAQTDGMLEELRKQLKAKEAEVRAKEQLANESAVELQKIQMNVRIPIMIQVDGELGDESEERGEHAATEGGGAQEGGERAQRGSPAAEDWYRLVV